MYAGAIALWYGLAMYAALRDWVPFALYFFLITLPALCKFYTRVLCFILHDIAFHALIWGFPLISTVIIECATPLSHWCGMFINVRINEPDNDSNLAG